eukprot:364435-Chlamydomonas_euryale.AAC.6
MFTHARKCKDAGLHAQAHAQQQQQQATCKFAWAIICKNAHVYSKLQNCKIAHVHVHVPALRCSCPECVRVCGRLCQAAAKASALTPWPVAC